MRDYDFEEEWIVHPDDPDLPSVSFNSKFLAEEYAAGLCCSYWIEEP